MISSRKRFVFRMLANLLVELVAVCIGIYIALNLDDIGRANEEEKSEITYLHSFVKNMNTDMEQLDELILYYENKTAALQYMIVLLDTTKELNYKSLDSIHGPTLEPVTFFPTKGAYNSIISSGHLSIIQNNDIRIELSNLYERFMYRIEYNSKVVDDATFNYFAYLENKYDFKERTFRPLSSVEILNLNYKLNHLYLYNNFYYNRLIDAKQSVNRVLRLITLELEGRDDD
ncbi:MAG: hypothetical protein JKY42_01010 [Flavobacteriales bacterium]|nr:hypothetical protein [Flavobacteriales bacterium]